MGIFDVLNMIGGLALFLFGMHSMGEGLGKASGGKLEHILEKMTNKPAKAVSLGAGVTAVLQSSSATTVMVVGFVNSGIMKLRQAIYIIMGANIGTTITSWILSLSGLDSSNFFVSLLKPTSFSPILAIIGVAFIMFSKNEKKKDVGQILVGFAVLMFGMNAMSEAVAPLKDEAWFTNILLMFTNPILGMIAGAVLTCIIQSSSASVGILQALCSTGAISFGNAIPIILGQNIGTCVTAMISSVGAKKNAKRAAFVHLYFNLIGTILFMVLFYALNAIIHFPFMKGTASEVGIAVVHTTFNVLATAVLLPCAKLLEKLACATVRDKEEIEQIGGDFQTLDPRFLDTPSYAVEQSTNVTAQMAGVSRMALFSAIEILHEYSEEKEERIMAMENKVDKYEDELGTYLVKISSHAVSAKDGHQISTLLHTISDLERISDHAVNLAESAKEMSDRKLHFSGEAEQELLLFENAVKKIMDMSIEAFTSEDMEISKQVEYLEEAIDRMRDEIKSRHVRRLTTGGCTIELGIVLQDVLTNLERVADHCSNIALYDMDDKVKDYNPHEYLDNMKDNDPNYERGVKKYLKEYEL